MCLFEPRDTDQKNNPEEKEELIAGPGLVPQFVSLSSQTNGRDGTEGLRNKKYAPQKL